jgi:hypothetical protein
MRQALPNVFHLCLYDYLKKKSGVRMMITRTEFSRIVGITFHIPTNLKYPLLKEMEIVNLLERIDRDWIKVKDSNLSSEDTSKIYRALHLY